MAELATLRDALLEELKDLYSAETQLLKALPKMEKKAESKKLKEAFRNHLKETEGQVKRLEQIGEILEEKLGGKVCKAMKGLIEEGSEVLELESDNPALVDALLIGAAQRVEHYEMAGYGTARSMAEALEEEEVVELLQATLEEEESADELLSDISEEEVLPMALESGDEGDDDDAEDEEEASPGSRRGGAALKTLILGLAAAGSLASTQYAAAETHHDAVKNEREAHSYAPDNTGRNARDENANRKTADEQALTGDTTEVLAKIRKEIVNIDDLSTYGKNVKIMVDKQVVTLRGPVRSAEEKTRIADAVTKVVPSYRIENDLEVAPTKG